MVGWRDRRILVFYLTISLKTLVTQAYLSNIHNFDGCQLTCFNVSTLKNRKKKREWARLFCTVISTEWPTFRQVTSSVLFPQN